MSRTALREAPSLFLCVAAAIVAASALLTAGCKPESPQQQPTTTPAAKPTRTVSPEESPQHLPTADIRVGSIALKVEVAATHATRQKGMMFRTELGPDEAMLFVFRGEDDRSFWMKNCYVDLDLAYIAPDGQIMQIEHMVARNTEGVPTRDPAQFVLEAPAGWFAGHKIAVGDKVVIPPEIATSAKE